MKFPYFLLLLFVWVSCKSLEPIVVDSQGFSSHGSVRENIDSIFIRDTVYRHDSVIYRERTIHDTVFITKEVYRDRIEAKGERRKAVRADTIRLVEYRDRVVEKPPERYVPKFYKWSTFILWLGIVLFIIYLILKLKIL